jgi:hypothetical protein
MIFARSRGVDCGSNCHLPPRFCFLRLPPPPAVSPRCCPFRCPYHHLYRHPFRRLEAATKQFGVPLLFSSDFHSFLPKMLGQRCRHLDTVTVKGSATPLGIYTLDLATRMPNSELLVASRIHFEQNDFLSNLQEVTSNYHPVIYSPNLCKHYDLITNFVFGAGTPRALP